jgi:transcriptional regulator with XRE-family HTH domain
MAGKSGRRGNDGDGPQNALQMFAQELKAQREAAGLTQEELGRRMGFSASVIAKLETCRTLPSPQHAGQTDAAFGLPGTFRRLRKGIVNSVHAPWVRALLDMEERATVLRNWQPLVVPGLLQTEAYARAVTGLEFGARLDEIEMRIALRMRRQELITGDNPPHLWAVIDEAALRRPYGGVHTMRAQLRHLIEMSELPHVTVQVMPFSAGGHAAAGGPITIIRFAEPELPDVVYLEQLTTALYPDRPSDLTHYWHVMNQLVTEAAPARQTPDLLREILDDI